MKTGKNSSGLSILAASLSLAVFIFMIVMNGLASAVRINGLDTGEVSALYPNLFVPAGITFSIWGLIYLFLLCFVVYAFYLAVSPGKTPVLDIKNHLLFFLSSIFNGVWILLWHYEKIGWSLLVMLGLFVVLLWLFLRLDRLKLNDAWKKLAVFIPISVYLGWITVATIANVTAFLVSLGWNGWGLSEAVWAVIMIIAGGLIAGGVCLTRKNTAYTLVVIWAYIGIIIKRAASEPVYNGIILAASVFLGILSILVIYTFIKKIVPNDR